MIYPPPKKNILGPHAMCQEAALAGHEDVWPGPGTMEFPGFSRRGLASTLSSTTNGAGCSTSKGQTKSDGRSSQC